MLIPKPPSPAMPIDRRDQWEKVGGFLDSMRQEGLTPDKVTFNTAIAAVASSGRCQMAFSLLAEMERGGLKPDQVSLLFGNVARLRGPRASLIVDFHQPQSEPSRVAISSRSVAIPICILRSLRGVVGVSHPRRSHGLTRGLFSRDVVFRSATTAF